MFLRKTTAGRTTDLDGFKFLAPADPAANPVNHFPDGNPHRYFNEAGIDHLSGEGKGFGPRAFFSSGLPEPGGAVSDNPGYIGKGLHIIDECRFSPQPGVGRERRFGPGHPPFPFNRRSEERRVGKEWRSRWGAAGEKEDTVY